MPYYTVTLRSDDTTIEYEVAADTFDEAQITATSYAFQDGFESPSVTSVALIESVVDPQPELAASGYTSYATLSAPEVTSATYTSYTSFTTPEAPVQIEEEAPSSGYTPYSSTARTSSEVAQAGFSATTKILASVPVSYHVTTDTGYAPYRTFRLKLPKLC